MTTPRRSSLLRAPALARLAAQGPSRRGWLKIAGAGGAGWLLSSLRGYKQSAWSHGSSLFSLGVASGDPSPDGFTLWTRLAPSPLIPSGGLPPRPVRVHYEVAEDPLMRRIVRSGTSIAHPERAHNLRVTLRGLRSQRHYWYRFFVGGEDSIIGRTKTLPDPRRPLSQLRLASVSCQDYQNGYFTAYEHLAQEELDAVLHLGDYIYEYAAHSHGPRSHVGEETQTLDDYRVRYAQYRLDPSLQAAHAAHPFICTWDDHEVQDNYSLAGSRYEEAQSTFAARRRAAQQAFLEHMPLGPAVRTQAGRTSMYRSFHFGDLVSLHMLDTRQHRSAQPCQDEELLSGTDVSFACDQLSVAERTMLGSQQEAWLSRALQRRQARWNVLGQQVMLTPWNLQTLSPLLEDPVYNMDAWDGYPKARERLLGLLARHQVRNPIVLSGDIHTAWGAQIHAAPNQDPVAAEFVTTSITSEFPTAFVHYARATLDSNPHIRYFEGHNRGYTRFVIGPGTWQSDFRTVSSISRPSASIETQQSLVVEAGSSRIYKG